MSGSEASILLLNRIKSKSYIDIPEAVLTADHTTVTELRSSISHGRSDAKDKLCHLSKRVAPDVDGWISQSQTLRQDLRESEVEAASIASEASSWETEADKIADVTNKARLLEQELVFNSKLSETLRVLQDLSSRLDRVEAALKQHEVRISSKLLMQTQNVLEVSSIPADAKYAGILHTRMQTLRQHAQSLASNGWNALFDVSPSSIRIHGTHESLIAQFEIQQQLKLDDGAVARLSKDFDDIILQPRLQMRRDGSSRTIEIEGQQISIVRKDADLSSETLYHDLSAIIGHVQRHLPPIVARPVAHTLAPHMIDGLINVWLQAAVPESLDDLGDFRNTLELTHKFVAEYAQTEWTGLEALSQWLLDIPTIFGRKMRSKSLGDARRLLEPGHLDTIPADREETQAVREDDQLLQGHANESHDWDASWSDDETTVPTGAKEDSDADDDGAEAWGWGDEDEDLHATEGSRKLADAGSKIKSITLKETFHITKLPQRLLTLIQASIQTVSDLEEKVGGMFAFTESLPILDCVPGLIVALYRASTATAYSQMAGGNMWMYNDGLWLSEHLPHDAERDFTEQQRLLTQHSKQAYSQEMRTQRTLLLDLLDGTEGLAHCTQHPFNQECDIAIASVTDRFRDIHSTWKDIISHSALMQSLGSLLSSICTKIINNIEDMADISEPESQQLTKLCSRVSELERLFVPEQAENAEMLVTAMYTPAWLKFQYLINLLESSLIDIKYLWTEGELSLEFEAAELVDLIMALFADSSHRKEAIAEIRRGPSR